MSDKLGWRHIPSPPAKLLLRVYLFLTGVITPLLFFAFFLWLSSSDFAWHWEMAPFDVQEVVTPFFVLLFPLLLPSFVSLTVLVFWPASEGSVWIRMGIYLGLLVFMTIWCLLFLNSKGGSFIEFGVVSLIISCAAIITWHLPLAVLIVEMGWLYRRFSMETMLVSSTILIVVSPLILGWVVYGLFMGFSSALLVSTLAYAIVAYRLWRRTGEP